MQLGPREERIAVAKAELAQAEADVDQGRVAAGQLHDPGADQRHDPEEERRRREHRQPDRLQRQLQPVRDGRPVGPGGRSRHSGARHLAQVQVGQKCRVRAEAYPEPDLRGPRRSPDADRRPGQRGDSGPREDRHSGRRRGRLPQAGDGGDRDVSERAHLAAGHGAGRIVPACARAASCRIRSRLDAAPF